MRLTSYDPFTGKRRLAAGLAAGLIIMGLAATVKADPLLAGTPPTVEQLQSLSLEDLANLEVTSVAKRPVSLSQAPAAIYVITALDIRRSSATALPEVLRLAPNLEVAKINAYSWTVTARGFNSPETANKLLVLVDGRSVYEPIGSGVLWQQIDVALDNIDRIEVISGPGGTLWGANAVNGVINIITKDAATTHGLFLRATSSPYKRSMTVRYGGKLGEHASYRIYADGFDTGRTRAATAGDSFDDAFKGLHAGFGIDGTASDNDSYTLKADIYDNTIVDKGGEFTGYDMVGGWTRKLRNGSTINVQAYMDHDVRDEPLLYEARDTLSIGATHAISFGERHQFVWGGELRQYRENFTSFNNAQFAQPKTTISLGSVFAQDEIALKPDLKLTLGLKAENSSYSGLDWLPNIRLAWQLKDDSMVWGAVSRAVRTPNRIERELYATGILLPAPNFQAEKLTAYEAGWRAQPTPRSSVSLSVFYNVYDDLRTWGYPPTILPITLQNGARGTTYGLEGWAKYDVTKDWRLNAGFNLLHKHFEVKPGMNDLSGLQVAGQDPNYQAQLRSEWNVTRHFEIDVWLRTVGKIDTAPVRAYSEANVILGWHIKDNVELSLYAANLLHARHIEVWDPSTAAPRYVGRSILASLRYGF